MKKDRFKVSIYQNEEVITISVQDVLSKLKQIKSYQKASLINIDININIFLANEIEKYIDLGDNLCIVDNTKKAFQDLTAGSDLDLI